MELAKHETCLEYFRRRLSEGWKCISLDGYNAVLLSPDGIRRELDLRDDVLTLRPSGAGDHTGIAGLYGALTHWQAVDEASPDDGGSYVEAFDIGTEQYDLYALPNHTTETGTINSVKVYNRCRKWGSPTAYCRPKIKTNGVEYDLGQLAITTSWDNYSKTWGANNPQSGSPWTWAEIDALQAGVGGQCPTEEWVQCTQVYVEVDYSPITETAYNTRVGNPTSWGWEKCDYGAAEQCPVGSETSWIWKAPTSGGGEKTMQGAPISFIWGSE